MHRILKIIKKISHYRANEIQPQTNDQLHMRNSHGNVPYDIIKFGKWFL